MTAGDELQRILRERATALAAPLPAAPRSDILELVVFRAGSKRYAIDAIDVEEAIEIHGVTLLPGLPPFYRGLIVNEGIVYPLVDIRPLAGAPFDDDFILAHAILFLSNERAIAVAAESVEAFARIDASSIGPSSAGEGPAIRGETDDGVVLLDMHILLADARLVIDDRG
jgi:chemotaxis signal transduction protein